MTVRKCTKLWTQKDGSRLRICDMDDSQVVNSLRLLRRMAETARETAIQLAAIMEARLTAEIATDLAEAAFNEACETSVEEHLASIYFDLETDAERRGLDSDLWDV